MGRVSSSNITRILIPGMAVSKNHCSQQKLWVTWYSVNCSQGSQDSHCSDGWEVQFLHIQAVLQSTRKYTGQLFTSCSYNSFIFIFKTRFLLKISDERKPKIKGQNYRTSHSTILKYFHHEEIQIFKICYLYMIRSSSYIEYPLHLIWYVIPGVYIIIRLIPTDSNRIVFPSKITFSPVDDERASFHFHAKNVKMM